MKSQGHEDVVINGMSSTCLACRRVWDTNDAFPPPCEALPPSDPPNLPQTKAYRVHRGADAQATKASLFLLCDELEASADKPLRLVPTRDEFARQFRTLLEKLP